MTRRPYGGSVGRLQGDVERGMAGIRADLDELAFEALDDDADWAPPAPATVHEALRRLAYHIRSNGNGGGTNIPIVQLPDA